MLFLPSFLNLVNAGVTDIYTMLTTHFLPLSAVDTETILVLPSMTLLTYAVG